MKKITIPILFFSFSSLLLIGQEKQEIIKNMTEDVTYLASDKLKGRATGTISEKLAAEYIRSKFQKI